MRIHEWSSEATDAASPSSSVRARKRRLVEIVGLSLAVAMSLAAFAVVAIGNTQRADGYSASGSTCNPSGNKGCFAQVLSGGAYDIVDFTWNAGDVGKAPMNATFPFAVSGDQVWWFDQWRNRLATGSRALYLTNNFGGGSACARLVYDSRTWVTHPPGSANYANSVANSAGTGIYGTCYNA